MKHTPGPWHIAYTHDDGTQIAIDDDFGMEGGRNYDLATVTHGDPEELRANARLIAAAPAMLEALLDALPYVEDVLSDPAQLAAFKPGTVQRHAKAIRAAIAAATEQA